MIAINQFIWYLYIYTCTAATKVLRLKEYADYSHVLFSHTQPWIYTASTFARNSSQRKMCTKLRKILILLLITNFFELSVFLIIDIMNICTRQNFYIEEIYVYNNYEMREYTAGSTKHFLPSVNKLICGFNIYLMLLCSTFLL